MRVAIVHSLPGRVRFRVVPGALAGKDTSGFAGALANIAGVKSSNFNPRTGSILFIYDTRITSGELIYKALMCLAHALPDIESKTGSKAEDNKKDKLAWGYVGYQLFRLFTPLALKPLVTVVGAIPFLIEGFKSLAKSHLNLPVLDAAAVGASLLQGNYNSASTLMMLLRTGEYLEAWAKLRSRENLAAALSLNVGQVWVRSACGTEHQIPYAELKQGDSIVLRSGTLIPVDGTVTEGRAMVNEAALTGEPLGREKTTGSTIYAGTVIEEGEIIAEVRGKGNNTRYEQIISLIEDGEGARAET